MNCALKRTKCISKNNFESRKNFNLQKWIENFCTLKFSQIVSNFPKQL